MKKPKLRLLIAGFTFILSGLFFCDAFPFRDEELVEKYNEERQEVSFEAIQRPQVAYTADTSRDPFKRTGEAVRAPVSAERTGKKELPKLSVQGVVWGGRFPQVIINNTVLKEGEIIEGARIIAIEKEGVTLFFEGAEYKLPSPAGGGAKPQVPLTPNI